MVSKRSLTGALLLGIGLAAGSGWVGSSPAHAAPQDYRFELAGKPQPTGNGKEIVPVRLVHVPDNKPVTDAVVFESKADMGPAGMPTMTAPVKPLPATQPGVYQFEVEPGMAGAWAITLAAKVQGETGTVRGSVTTDLAK
jgi:YtkA-like